MFFGSENKKLLVFGDGTLSEMSAYLFKADVNVFAHVVDSKYKQKETLNNTPVLELESLFDYVSNQSAQVILPLGYTDINGVRENKFKYFNELGIEIASFIHASSTVWDDFKCQKNVIIYEQVIIQPFVQVGENTLIRAGTNLGHHTVIGKNCFIASHVVTGGNVTINERCFIGLGATIRDGITIAERCFIGAGAVVVGDTEVGGVYLGNPAKKITKTSAQVTNTI